MFEQDSARKRVNILLISVIAVKKNLIRHIIKRKIQYGSWPANRKKEEK